MSELTGLGNDHIKLHLILSGKPGRRLNSAPEATWWPCAYDTGEGIQSLMGHLMVPLKSRNQSSMGSPMVRMLDVTFQCNQSVWGKKAFDEGGLCEQCKCPPNQGWLVGRSMLGPCWSCWGRNHLIGDIACSRWPMTLFFLPQPWSLNPSHNSNNISTCSLWLQGLCPFTQSQSYMSFFLPLSCHPFISTSPCQLTPSLTLPWLQSLVMSFHSFVGSDRTWIPCTHWIWQKVCHLKRP